MNFEFDLSLPDFLKKHLGSVGNTKENTCLFDIWCALAEKNGSNTLLFDEYCNLNLTVKEFTEQVAGIAAALQKLGVKQGQHVALFAENSAKWMVIDQAIMAIGAVDAVRGSGSPHSELEYIYEHSDSTALITDDMTIAASLSKNPQIFDKKRIKFIIYIGNKDVSGYVKLMNMPCYTFETLRQFAVGKRFWKPKIKKHDPATIVYSSGTTGRPKGIMLSHYNIVSQISAIHPAINVKKGKSALNVLPIWHMYERTCEYYAMSRAATLYYTNIRNFKKDLAKYRPNYLFSVPRIWVTVYDSIMSEVRSKSLLAQLIFGFFLNTSKTTKKMKRILGNRCIYTQDPSSLQQVVLFFASNILRPIDKFAMKFVYKKIKNVLGGKFIKGISGGGALPHHVEDFFEAVGVPIFVGYGLTETSPVLSVRKEENNKLYSVGPPLPLTEFKIVNPETKTELPRGSKGLVLVKGPQIMLGYYKDIEATHKVIDNEGWLSTGDLGWLTNDNNLVLSGRIKDIIVLLNGENIETDTLEDTVLQIPYISQIVLTGQDKPNLTALVVANMDEIARVLGKKQDTDPNTLKDFKAMLLNEINAKIKTRVNFRVYERVSDIHFVKEPFSFENGLMTQTQKIKKNEVCEKYKNEIEKMYA